MANPQPDKFTKISNEIIDALAKINLYPYAYRVFWCILRKTYGFHKKEDRISLSQFSEYTGLDKRLVHRAITSLSSKQMIIIKRESRKRVYYGIQKDYEKWGKIVIDLDDSLSSIKMTKPPDIVIYLDTHKRNKRNYTKEREKREMNLPPNIKTLDFSEIRQILENSKN